MARSTANDMQSCVYLLKVNTLLQYKVLGIETKRAAITVSIFAFALRSSHVHLILALGN